jgi:hypothetical protein
MLSGIISNTKTLACSNTIRYTKCSIAKATTKGHVVAGEMAFAHKNYRPAQVWYLRRTGPMRNRIAVSMPIVIT